MKDQIPFDLWLKLIPAQFQSISVNQTNEINESKKLDSIIEFDLRKLELKWPELFQFGFNAGAGAGLILN